MNKILIAEDEKFIRQGLKTMVRRAPVPVEEILEARDGEEALAILREQTVDLRIDEAKRLLEATDRRVNEIGRSVGFSDEKHFLKVFKSAVGMSPTEYRKSALLLQRKQQEDK